MSKLLKTLSDDLLIKISNESKRSTKVELVKFIMAETKCSLRDAKDLADHLQN